MKAGRKVLEGEWKRMRRGWYLGDEGFGGRMLKRVKATLGKGRAAAYLGPAKRAHGELAAERRVAQGLVALGLEGQRLVEKPKGHDFLPYGRRHHDAPA